MDIMFGKCRMGDTFRPVFVMGCPRSGTTMFKTMLGRHSTFAAPRETHYFPLCYLPNPRATEVEELIRLFSHNPHSQDLGIDTDELRHSLGDGTSSHAAFLQAVLSSYASKRGKPFVVEKTPDHLPFTPMILDWFPHAKCVCLVRDGRDVVLSLKRVAWAHGNTFLHSLHWRYAATLASTFETRYPDNFRVIHYEDILAHPRVALSSVMEFLGTQFEERQLDPSVKSSAGGKPAEEVDRNNTGKWRDTATRREVRIMHSVMGDHLRRYGYSLDEGSEWSLSGIYAAGAEVLMRLAYSPRCYWLWRLYRPVRPYCHAIMRRVL